MSTIAELALSRAISLAVAVALAHLLSAQVTALLENAAAVLVLR